MLLLILHVHYKYTVGLLLYVNTCSTESVQQSALWRTLLLNYYFMLQWHLYTYIGLLYAILQYNTIYF